MMVALMSIRERVEPEALGPLVLESLARSVERGREARTRCDERRFVDVAYRDVVGQPLAVAERIYEHFGLELTPRAHAAMDAHVAAHPQNKHGVHAYSLEQFGLTANDVSARLGRYMERFGLRTDR